jgi:hypothetical protein
MNFPDAGDAPSGADVPGVALDRSGDALARKRLIRTTPCASLGDATKQPDRALATSKPVIPQRA